MSASNLAMANTFLQVQFLKSRLKPSSKSKDFIELERLLDEMIAKLKAIDLREIDELESGKIQRKVNALYNLAKLSLTIKGVEWKLAKRLYAKALSLKLGAKIPYQMFLDPKYDEFKTFVEVNGLHHKFQSLNMQMQVDEDLDPLIPINSGDKTLYVSWTGFCKKPKTNGKAQIIGYEFSYFNQRMFETYKNLKITNDYTFIYLGLTSYNSFGNEPIIAYNKLDPKQWGGGYVLEIWTMLKDTKQQLPTMGVGDHSHITLKDEQGYLYSMGKFYQGSQMPFKEYFTLFAKKKGRFCVPDMLIYLPKDLRDFHKTTVRLTKKQFEKLFERLSKDRTAKRPAFSLLQENCVSYVENLLKDILDYRVDSSIYLPKYLAQVMLPKPFQSRLFSACDRFYLKLPKWMKKAIYFGFPLYPMTIAIGLFLKLFAMKNNKGYKGEDFSMSDIFIRPWNIKIHHPLELRKSLLNNLK